MGAKKMYHVQAFHKETAITLPLDTSSLNASLEISPPHPPSQHHAYPILAPAEAQGQRRD